MLSCRALTPCCWAFCLPASVTSPSARTRASRLTCRYKYHHRNRPQPIALERRHDGTDPLLDDVFRRQPGRIDDATPGPAAGRSWYLEAEGLLPGVEPNVEI